MGTMYEVDQSTGAVGDPVIGDGPIIGGNAIITKLWENSDPSSGFSAQTVQIIGLLECDFIDISIQVESTGSNASYVATCRVPVIDGKKTYLSMFSTLNKRAVTIDGNSLAFSAGEGGGSSTATNSAVPLSVYGIKLKEV